MTRNISVAIDLGSEKVPSLGETIRKGKRNS